MRDKNLRYFNIERNRLTYDKIASEYDKLETNLFDKPIIDEFLKQLSGKKILDVGCGCGVHANYFAFRGFKVNAIDYSQKMLEIAKTKVPNVKFSHANLLDFSTKQKFDGIFCNNTIHNLTKAQALEAIDIFYNLLNDGGLLFLSVYDGRGEGFIDEVLGENLKTYVAFYRLEEIAEMLQHKFDCLKVYSVNNLDGTALSPWQHKLILKKRASNNFDNVVKF